MWYKGFHLRRRIISSETWQCLGIKSYLNNYLYMRYKKFHLRRRIISSETWQCLGIKSYLNNYLYMRYKKFHLRRRIISSETWQCLGIKSYLNNYLYMRYICRSMIMCCSRKREVVRAETHYHTSAWQTLIWKRLFYRHCYIPSFPAHQAKMAMKPSTAVY